VLVNARESFSYLLRVSEVSQQQWLDVMLLMSGIAGGFGKVFDVVR